MSDPDENLWPAIFQYSEGDMDEWVPKRRSKSLARCDLQSYVTFAVADEVFGLKIDVIDQILKRADVPTTPVPRTPEFVIGIGNVKGVVMPVINLAQRLCMKDYAMDRSARILVVRHHDELHGIEVRKIMGVHAIAPETFEETPRSIGKKKAEFVAGLGQANDVTVILLDLDKLLEPADFSLYSEPEPFSEKVAM